jgi:hypothetical protein
MRLPVQIFWGLTLISFCGFLMGVAQEAPPATPAPNWIPFEYPSGSALPIVDVRINGRQAQPMVIDYSVREVLLDTLLVAATGMKLSNQGETVQIEYYGSKEKVSVAYLDTVEVGRVGRQGVRTLLIELGDDIGVRDGLRAYGRVGLEFLEPFRLTVHYPRKLLLLEPSPEGEIPDGSATFERGERALAVDVLVNESILGRFVLDPSASVVAIDKKWAQKIGLVDGKAQDVLLSSLRVGSFTAGEVRARLSEMKKLPYGGKPQGVIGSSLLRELSVTYDFPRSLVWLRRGEGGPS